MLLRGLRLVPALLLAALAYGAVVVFLALIVLPWQTWMRRGESFGRGLIASACFQIAVLSILATLHFTEVLPEIPQIWAEVTLLSPDPTEQVQAITLTETSSDSPARDNLLRQAGADLGGDPLPTFEVPHAKLFAAELESASGSSTLDVEGEDWGRQIGGGTSDGSSTANFFGITAGGKNFIFVMDISGSMEGVRFRRARNELRRSIDSLSPEQQFYIIFYSSGMLPMPVSKMLPATIENRAQTWRWIQKVRCGGDTNPEPGLMLALSLHPDAIFLLSDGEFNPQAAVRVCDQQKGTDIPIHTVGLGSRDGERLLKAISERTGGVYRFVK